MFVMVPLFTMKSVPVVMGDLSVKIIGIEVKIMSVTPGEY